MENTILLMDGYQPTMSFFDGLTEAEPCQGPEEVEDINVHLTRRITGQWMAKKDICRDRSSSKPKITKDQKKKKNKLANASRKRNKK